MNATGGLLVWLLLPALTQAGILVSRSDKGLQFSEASSVLLNGKDKALSLGAQPKLSGPVNKLPGVKLGAALVRNADARVLAQYQNGNLSYLVPEGLAKTAPADPAEIWKTTRISYKKSDKDKTPSDISPEAFLAFLPDGAQELAEWCQDTDLLEIVGGKGKALATQLEFLAAAIKAYPADPAVAPLEKFVEQSMRQRYEQFETGAVGVDVLEQGLQFAALSDAVYPQAPAQRQLRESLRLRKSWLDRKIAVLRAFAAAKEWDAFVLGNRDFERYEQAYPEMQKRFGEALRASLALHRQNAEEMLKQREYGAAWREFRRASMRQPSDKVLQQNLMIAWTDHSRQVAIDRQRERKQLTAGQRNVIDQALLFATRFLEAKKPDDALKSVTEAEAIDPASLPVLLKKAEVLGALRAFAQAMAALDEYDLRAVDEERERANKLRSELLYQRTSTVQDLKAQFNKAWAEGRFHAAHSLALQGLRAQDDDTELLYDAGASAVVVRNVKDSRAFFARYLEVANTLDANSEQRLKVRVLLSGLSEPVEPVEGAANWFSGKKLPAGVYYDPVSLAFQPRIDKIEASGKFKVSFEWDGDRLRAIVPAFEKNERATGERKVSFAYDPRFPQVNSVTYEDGARAASGSDPDEIVRQSTVMLSNNPYADPAAIEKFTGKSVTIGISGNRFFEPFVWDRIHSFHFTYDTAGRVIQAKEIADSAGAAGDSWLEFEWDGPQLQAIRGYQGDASRRMKIYERKLQYQDGRLVAEDIQAQGKSSHVKYAYTGGRLVAATCDKDPTLDDRSRQVTFR